MEGWSHATFSFTGREARMSTLDFSAQMAYGGEIRMEAQSLADLDVDLSAETYYYER